MDLEKQHSTAFASLHLTDYLNLKINKLSTPLSIFLDLSKSFETLNHKIVLSKFKTQRNKCHLT